MKVLLHREAYRELDEAAWWYEERHRGLGEEFASLIESQLDEIGRNPERFGRLEYPPEFASKVRRVVVKRFRYVIAYTIRESDVFILAIYHAHREPGYWRDRLEE